jgi:hypothetical protein
MANSGISPSKMPRAIGMAESNYSAFLAGKTGIGSEATCLLLKYTAMNSRQAIATFSKPVFSASVLHLQKQGKHLRFNNPGWVAREGGTDDPNGTTSITGTSYEQRLW